MDKSKSKICFVLSVICITVGASIINEGFGLIVAGAWFFVGSFVEYLKEDDATNKKEELHDHWHPTCQMPIRDAYIIFRNSKNGLFKPVKFFVRSLNVYTPDAVEPYSWEKYYKTFVYDEWAYINELT